MLAGEEFDVSPVPKHGFTTNDASVITMVAFVLHQFIISLSETSQNSYLLQYSSFYPVGCAKIFAVIVAEDFEIR